MGNLFPVFKRELKVYFYSPIAYAVLAIFLAIAGYFFYNNLAFFNLVSFQAMQNPALAQNLNAHEWVMRPLFSNLSIIMLLILPMLTMRLFSEEKKVGTAELLLTYPIKDIEALGGKFLACLAVFALMLGLTFLLPLSLKLFGNPEFGPILSGYLGLFLMGAAFISLGVLFSSLTENQIIAGVLSFGSLLFFWIIGWSSSFAGSTLGALLDRLSILNHLDGFTKGVIDTKDLIFYINFAIFCLFLTLRSLESSRWRG